VDVYQLPEGTNVYRTGLNKTVLKAPQERHKLEERILRSYRAESYKHLAALRLGQTPSSVFSNTQLPHYSPGDKL